MKELQQSMASNLHSQLLHFFGVDSKADQVKTHKRAHG